MFNKQNGKKQLLILCVLITSVVISIISLLIYSNPLASKWVYIFQAYIYPKHEKGVISLPTKYTGIWKIWYPNGTLKFVGVFTNGIPDGKRKIFYTNGNIKIDCFYKNGLKHGKWTVWREDGTKEIELVYSKGKKHGISVAWDENQKVIEVEKHINGKLVSSLTTMDIN